MDNIKSSDGDICAHNFIKNWAEKTPLARALVFEDQYLTYQQFNQLANQFANHLIDSGVKPSTLVGISMNRSLEMLIAVLGTLKTGAGYVPLDPTYPQERIAYMIADAQLAVVLTQKAFENKFVRFDVPVVYVEKDWLSRLSPDDCRPDILSNPDNLAYAIHTSGSTGKPKGVMVPHRSLCNFMEIATNALGGSSDDIYLLSASLNYALSVRQIFVPLYQGAALVIASEQQVENPLSFLKLLNQQKITRIDLVPSYWQALIETLEDLSPQQRLNLLDNSLKQIVSIGEQLLSDLPNKWANVFNHPARLINIYGQTETTGIVTAFEIPKDLGGEKAIVPIGLPVLNTNIMLMDENLSPVSPGETGEICISNPCLARGYLNNVELTNRKFISMPGSGARLYRTGVLGRLLQGGNIEHLGRLNHIESYLLSPMQQDMSEAFNTGQTDMRIFHLVEVQAKRSPDAIFVAAPGRTPLRYGALCRHIKKTVKTLNMMGVGRNDRVVIVLPNGPEMAVAFLTVASGATSAPLSPAHRLNEFEFYFSDLDARALIIQAGMNSPAREAAQTLDIPIIELLPMLEAEAGVFSLTYDQQSGEANNNGFAEPDDIALALYTSGTTSQPKMTPLTHINLFTSAHNILKVLELTSSDRCLNIMPLYHIHGLSTLFSSLAAGASVVCTPDFNASQFFEWLEEFRPTWYTSAPTLHQAILARAAAHQEVIERNPLRFIRSASSSLPPQVMAELEQTLGAPVIESYGMTEASPQITSNPLPPLERKIGSVGLAAGPEVAIMGEGGNLLSPGETGEVVIRGANVTKGYENNPTANKYAFVNGWFRTGDQGVLDSEGYLFITGRLKEIINRGGEKVAPREVDEALLDHPAVIQAVSFAVPHKTLGEDLVAAVVLKKDATVSEKEIREFVFTQLVDYKVPSQVLIVDKIPTSHTEKSPRIGLAEKLASMLKTEFIAPDSLIEKALARLYIKVLGLEQVGVNGNFFRLGGNSLQATQLVAQMRAAFQVELPLTTIFRNPTIAELAPLIEDILINEIEDLTEEEAQQFFE